MKHVTATGGIHHIHLESRHVLRVAHMCCVQEPRSFAAAGNDYRLSIFAPQRACRRGGVRLAGDLGRELMRGYQMIHQLE